MVTLKDAELRKYVVDSCGEEGLSMAKILGEMKDATDTEIAEKLGEKPSHVRKALYHLYEARVAEYYQKKDKETGWQTFHWKLSLENAKHAMEKRKESAVKNLETKLEFEQSHRFFICPRDQSRLSFEEATENVFHCPKCNGPLDYEENKGQVKELKHQIEEMRGE
ncbi:MAG: hypothetical protein HY556_03340 [Euryarchaeota archaeon]|nr:hypothetical protein [Euryarchaeota archaeon]